MSLTELQPYLTAASAGLSVATLGFLLNVLKTIRDNAQDRIAVQEERIKMGTEDQQRAQKWAEREKADLTSQLDRAKKDMDELLKKEGLDLPGLALGKQLSESAMEVRATTQRLTAEMKSTLEALSSLAPSAERRVNSSVELSLAMGAMAAGEYDAAALHLDRVAEQGRATWDAHFSRGVSHASARGGHESDVAALMAYNDALAIAPRDMAMAPIARMFSYRGAILKRLNRLDESVNDLQLALRLADEVYERVDAHYNLACVYAMQGNREKMLEHLGPISGDSEVRYAVTAHRDDYFRHFSEDPALQKFIEGAWNDSEAA